MSPPNATSLLFLAHLLARRVHGFLPHASTMFSKQQQLLQPGRTGGVSRSSSPCTPYRYYCSSRRRSGLRMMSSKRISPTDKLRALMKQPEIVLMPSCYDGLSARLVEDAGFPATFMTGFGVSGAHGMPDTQLISYAEMLTSGTTICSALKDIPCIGDGDTGYGNSMNVKRTVKGYAQAGMAGIMIEDQVAPKRCGHTKGKSVVGREEAYNRIRAACDARDEGADILVVARTDAREGLGLEEAIERCREFIRIGADITFLDAPNSKDEMRRYCQEVDGPKLAVMLEFGKSPVLPPAELQEMGYSLVTYPITLLSSSIKAMKSSLARLKAGEPTDDLLENFGELKRVVGFGEYDENAAKYEPE